MRTVFADTVYWVSLINPVDIWGDRVLEFAETAQNIRMVTTDEVLIEVLAFYSKSGNYLRQQTTVLVKSILNDPTIQVIDQTHTSFLMGLELYERRVDKGYSLTDCISMNTMRNNKIQDVLTHDRHFAQEGFVILFD